MKYWLNEETNKVAALPYEPKNESWARVCRGNWVEISKERYDIVVLYRNYCLSHA